MADPKLGSDVHLHVYAGHELNPTGETPILPAKVIKLWGTNGNSVGLCVFMPDGMLSHFPQVAFAARNVVPHADVLATWP